MADNEDSERSEEPTPQRREDFRRRGQVAQSREVASVMVLLMSILAIWLLGRFFLGQLHELFTRSFSDYVVTSARNADWFDAVKFAVIKSFMVVGPLAAILWIVGVTASVVQIGFLNSEEALKLNFERLDPVAGFKRIF